MGRGNRKLNRLLFMDNPNLFVKTEVGLDNLVQFVKSFSYDITMNIKMS